jgi:hypothetical protein
MREPKSLSPPEQSSAPCVAGCDFDTAIGAATFKLSDSSGTLAGERQSALQECRDQESRQHDVENTKGNQAEME